MNDVFDSTATMKFGIGQPIRRLEDVRLLTGKGHYQDDQTLHRQTWCVFVRSPHAHARIRSIDTDAASRAAGVVAVFTGTDYANDGIAMPKAAMPRKKREIRREYLRAGYREEQGKGDHTKYRYPGVDETFVVDGRDGADARDYDEGNLKRALRKIAEAKKREQQP